MRKFVGKNLFIFFVSLIGVFFIFSGVLAQTIDAPTLIEPAEGAIADETKPMIKGLAPSGTFVSIYIDGAYNGKTDYLNDESGAAGFTYSPYVGLNSGAHRVWAIAENKDGSKSDPSNILNFKIELPIPEPPAGEVVAVKIEESVDAVSASDDIIDVEELNEVNEEVIEIIKEELTEEDGVGLVDENNEKQGRLSPNIIIFILFLIGIIAWILWVNKELIKEKKKEKENNN